MDEGRKSFACQGKTSLCRGRKKELWDAPVVSFLFLLSFFQKLPRAICKEKENLVHSANTFIVQSMFFEAFLSCLTNPLCSTPYSTSINCRSHLIFSISNHLLKSQKKSQLHKTWITTAKSSLTSPSPSSSSCSCSSLLA